jgi:hypothetical protein
VFRDEALEHIEVLAGGVGASGYRVDEAVARAFHTLAGSAAMVWIPVIAELARAALDLVQALLGSREYVQVEGPAAESDWSKAAKRVAAPGPVLTGQVSTVERLIADAETPMRVALASDNQTEVTIYRVGRLGAFERKDMELLPGRYTVVGVRPGYRDVRRELTLLPGSAAPTLVIRCEEPI